MTRRTLVGLAAALVVLALLAVYGQRSDSSSRETRPLLPRLEAALGDVDRVVTVAGGEQATLERRADAWTVAEKDGYPADVERLREALLALAEARIVERKTSNPEYYERLGVDPVSADGARGVAMSVHAGDAVFETVIVGDLAREGSRYVRLADEPTSYLVDRDIDVPASPAQWAAPRIVDVAGDRVRRVIIEHPDGETVRIFKTDRSEQNFSVEDVPDGRELSYPGAANVVSGSLRDLRLEDVEAADSQNGDEAFRTTFTTFDGLEITVAGVEEGDGGWITLQARAAGVDDVSQPGPADAAEDGASAAGGDEAVPADASEEAAGINERVRGWRYRIADRQFEQMSRRLEDLLQPVED